MFGIFFYLSNFLLGEKPKTNRAFRYIFLQSHTEHHSKPLHFKKSFSKKMKA